MLRNGVLSVMINNYEYEYVAGSAKKLAAISVEKFLPKLCDSNSSGDVSLLSGASYQQEVRMRSVIRPRRLISIAN